MLMDTRIRDPKTSSGPRSLSMPRKLVEGAFRRGDVPAVRRFTQAFGARAGMTGSRLADLVLAASEAAACATAWGPTTARVRLWITGTRAFCEVRGDGLLRRNSRRGLREGEEDALRRWVLQQVSDNVSVASEPNGVRVVLSLSLA